MFSDQAPILAPDAKVRPSPEFEKILTESLDTYSRDLKGIAARMPENCIVYLAYQGIKAVRAHGTFTEGHSHKEFVFMRHALSGEMGKVIHINLHVDARQNPVHEIGLDFFGRETAGDAEVCVFRCYVRAGAGPVNAELANLASIKQAMLQLDGGEAEKWRSFSGLTVTGQYSEDPVCVTAVSHENYERMKLLQIKTENPEDLARAVVEEYGSLFLP